VKKIFPGHGAPVVNNGNAVLKKILQTLEVNEEFPI
jgi:hypothetical protein